MPELIDMEPLCPRRDTGLEANPSLLKNGTESSVLSRTIRFLDKMGSEARAAPEERREENIYPSWKSFDGDNWVAFGSTLKQKTRKKMRIKKGLSEWRWVNLKMVYMQWYRTKKCVNQRRSCAMFIAITPDQSLFKRDFRFYCMERWKEPGSYRMSLHTRFSIMILP